jgi:hypothetical protein
LTIGDGAVRSRIGPAAHADAVLTGPARVVARVLLARASLAQARRHGVSYTGDRRILDGGMSGGCDVPRPRDRGRGTVLRCAG